MYVALIFQVLPTTYALCLRFLYFDIGNQLAVGQPDRGVDI